MVDKIDVEKENTRKLGNVEASLKLSERNGNICN